jgi:hypothetical protein
MEYIYRASTQTELCALADLKQQLQLPFKLDDVVAWYSENVDGKVIIYYDPSKLSNVRTKCLNNFL